MDYEKKYKEALGWMQSLYNGLHGKTKEEAEKYFPELQESEDERIRKRLIEFFEDWGETKSHCWGKSVNKILAWLEKQGEKKVSVDDFKAKDWYVSKVDGKIHDMTYNPADKVEPKFHEGDWIINDQGSAFQIAYIDTENCRYVFEIGGYTKEEMNYENIAFANSHYRKWTLDDAKDGDVLYSLDNNQPFIYKKRKLNEQATAYCGLNIYGKFFVWGTKDCIITLSNYVPATKEQRDTLLKAMADAGYTFDFEKKELKLLISNGGDFESNNSKQKTTWSEDDERIVTALMEGFRYHQLFNPRFGEVPNAEIISWIKSLKERLKDE